MESQSMPTQRATLEIIGLGCGGGGTLSVERALARLPGVVRAYVNPATETAYVEYDSSIAGATELVAAAERAGFRALQPVPR
jgi:Cu+-exporting ATPase